MNIEEAKRFLQNSLKSFPQTVQMAQTAGRYYLAQNDILYEESGREKETELLRSADNRIPHSFYPLLVNQKAAYLFSDPPLFSVGSDHWDRVVQNTLGGAFSKICKSLCVKASNTGCAWLHYWQDENGGFCYGALDASQVVPVYSDDMRRILLRAIRVYRKDSLEGMLTVYEIWDRQCCQAFAHQEDSGIEEGLFPYAQFAGGKNEYRHPFAAVPFIPFANNEQRRCDLEPIKRLIDIYDKTYSGFANDLEDIQEVIMTLSGYSGTDIGDFLSDLKKYKVIKLDDLSDKPGVDTLSIEIPVQAREKMLEITRKAIFEEGQGVDPQQSQFGNASGVALQFMFSLLELKASLTETEFRGGFEELVRAILRHYGQSVSAVSQVWTRTAIRNDKELSEIALNSRELLSRQTLLARHPWVENAVRETELIKEEENGRDNSAE